MTEGVDTAWFERLAAELDDEVDPDSGGGEGTSPVGIGLTDDGGEWLPRSEYVGPGGGGRRFVLDAKGVEETVRYFPRLGGDRPGVEERYRYELPVAGVADPGEGVRSIDPGGDAGVSLVLELPGPAKFGRLRDGGSMGFPAEALGAVGAGERFRPVGAKRVAGLADEKRRLVRFLTASNADWGLTEATGVVLEGPPGTGKTELVMEVCQERFGRVPVTISGPEILSKWVGESERLLRRKFDEARESDASVLYIDELDAIARARGEATEDYSAQIVAQLLVLLDGVEAKRRSDERPLKVVASTNLSHVVDPALRRPGRLGNRPIGFERPGKRARLAILHHYLERIHARVRPPKALGPTLTRFVEGEFDAEFLARMEADLAADMEGFTGADVEDVVHEALAAVRRDRGDRLTYERIRRTLDGEFSPAREYRTEEIAPADLRSGSGVGSAGGDSGTETVIDRGEFSIDPGTTVVELGDAGPAAWPAGGADEAGDPSTADAGTPAADAVARAYLRSLLASGRAGEVGRFRYRVAGPGDLLDADAMRTRENAVELFSHAGDERVVVYLRGADRLLAARERSAMVDRLVGAVTEQVLQWNEENLLIVDATDGDPLVPVPGGTVRIGSGE